MAPGHFASWTPAPVAVTRCTAYEQAQLAPAVQRAVERLGGWPAFVQPGQSALIKPNLLTDRPPEQAVTTHPELVRTVIRALKAIGARPFVADSPNSVAKLERVWDRTGFAALCQEEDVALVNLEKAGAVRMRHGEFSFSIAKPILEADVVVNMPKVKTHVLTILTAGIKNMYGAVPGYEKTRLHKQYPRARQFGKLLLEIHNTVRPALTLADGILGMEGDGPSGGRPAALGFLAASADTSALDLVLCRILGIPPRSVPTLRAALANGSLPSTSPPRIDDPGAPALEHPIRYPSTLRGQMIPAPLVKLVGRALWIRPEFLDACVRCGKCVEACPVQALQLTENRPHPQLLKGRCIDCCCCHEVCPHNAIQMHPSPLLKLARRSRPF